MNYFTHESGREFAGGGAPSEPEPEPAVGPPREALELLYRLKKL